MRTVKASEVVKGMRVRVEQVCGTETTRTVEGPVSRSDKAVGTDLLVFHVGSLTLSMDKDHPVTVLAEPEPEWVEGAWYWTHAGGQEKPAVRLRLARGWASGGSDSEIHTYTDMHDDGLITVLGRVLIVDWPGDDAARELVEAYSDGDDYTIPANQMAVKVADAIRTQGGAR